ncbi:Type I-MYXAN CRISPR-associated protein Cas6/Cmx6 [Gammaproteobacteria bacterium]
MNANDGNHVASSNPYWQENCSPIHVADDMVDLAFTITCRSLPVDHAWALSQAIQERLSWWHTEPHVGLHLIHGGDSGNGWQRPEKGSDMIYLTKRTRLTLRLPRSRLADARSALVGQTLTIANSSLITGEALERRLVYQPALYARHVVVSNVTDDESVFLADAARELQAMAVRFKKMLAGKLNVLMTPKGPCVTRSLLVADLRPEDAIELQRRGLGPRRILGCGLFIPHKALADTDRFSVLIS